MVNIFSRRDLLKLASFAVLGLYPRKSLALEDRIMPPTPEYRDVSHSSIEWTLVNTGLEFAKIDVHRREEKVDKISVLKIDPKYNKLQVFTAYDQLDAPESQDIQTWQAITGATALINSAQYEAKPWGQPCGLAIRRGKNIGPLNDARTRGMLVAEPKDIGVPQIDLLDFKYDRFDPKTTTYTEGVQHWPILLDRNGRIRVNPTDWQANRTVIAKDHEGKILVFTTEGGFFTLYNFGRFLRESNKRTDHGFNVHTAMNLDGGYEAQMMISSKNTNYVTYGQYETYGTNNNASVKGARIKLPTVIGIRPRS